MMIENPLLTVWLRLVCAWLVFYMLFVVIGSVPIRSTSVDSGKVLKDSLSMVFKGPVFPVFQLGKTAGFSALFVFWATLLILALRSGRRLTRRRFYVMFWFFIIMTVVGLAGEIVMGLIAMAHALG